ncbi:hypothetical protein I4U23_009237 [Adineta vaga]|nr:hypothetical protein I4U23_009237 [Adineta vaga]
MSLDAKIDQETSSSTPSTRRNYLIVPSFNPERRHSWGNVILHPSRRANIATSSLTIASNTNYLRSPPPPVISITRSSSSSELLAATIRPFLAEREKQLTSTSIPSSRPSVSSSIPRSFPFRCCGRKKHSSQIPPVEQISTTGHQRRKSSTPSISSRPLPSTLIQNHQKTNPKTTITSSSTATTATTTTTTTKLINSTKKRQQRGGMASACVSCVSSNHNRRRSSARDDTTITDPIHSSQTPPLLIRLGQIILRRPITSNTNHNRIKTVKNKIR